MNSDDTHIASSQRTKEESKTYPSLSSALAAPPPVPIAASPSSRANMTDAYDQEGAGGFWFMPFEFFAMLIAGYNRPNITLTVVYLR